MEDSVYVHKYTHSDLLLSVSLWYAMQWHVAKYMEAVPTVRMVSDWVHAHETERTE